MTGRKPKSSAEMTQWDHLSNLFLTLLGRGTYPTWCFHCGIEERAYSKGPPPKGWRPIYLTGDGGPPADRSKTNRMIVCPRCIADVMDKLSPQVVEEYIASYGDPRRLRPDMTLAQFAAQVDPQ